MKRITAAMVRAGIEASLRQIEDAFWREFKPVNRRRQRRGKQGVHNRACPVPRPSGTRKARKARAG